VQITLVSRWQHGGGQDDRVAAVRPRQHFGKPLGGVGAVQERARDLSPLVSDHCFLLAARDLEAAGKHIVLAVAHQSSKGTILEAPFARAGHGERSGFRIGQPASYQETRALHELQGGHRVVAAQASREGVGQAARDQVNFARVAAHGTGWNNLDPHRLRGCQQGSDQLTERAAFPFGRQIRGE
jgi:hypothetical protein